MTADSRGQFAIPARRHTARLAQCLGRLAAVMAACLISVSMLRAQSSTEFHRTLTVNSAEPLVLDIEIDSADLQIVYAREGEVSISALAKSSSESSLGEQFFSKILTIQQEGNRLTLRSVANAATAGIDVRYRIDVPYRTEVTSRSMRGKQNISGVLGPVTAKAGQGDVKISYVSKAVLALVESGDIDLQVIGERGEARTRSGNVSCSRAAAGVTAESGDGDITLAVVGPSTAIVRKGTGRIDVGGARGSLIAATAGGDLHVKAIPHDDWKLTSMWGTIRVELPPLTKIDLNAATDTGEFQIDREDIPKPEEGARRVTQTVNGGGKRVEIHSGSGRIVVR